MYILNHRKLILLVFLVVVITLMMLITSCSQITTGSIGESSSQNKESTLGQDMTEPNISDYILTVDGLVDNPLKLTYESLLQYPIVTKKVRLVCPGIFEEDREWTGVPVSTLLAEAGLKPQASKVIFYASLDNYMIDLPLILAQQDGVFVAYKVDNEVLSHDDGYPIRLVVEQREGSYWVKWLDHIEVS